MKVIKKESEFNGRKNQKFYVERFDNYREFLKVIEERQSEAHKKKREFNLGSCQGINSWEEANKLLLNGWDKPVPHINAMFNKSLMKVKEKVRVRQFANVQGYMPIVANALLNLPNSMIDSKIEARKTKIVDFLIMIDRACGVSAEEIEKKMSYQLAGIASLERDQGYRCRISVCFAPCGDTPNSNYKTAGIVKVKDESQPFDIKRLAFPIAHAGMLRALMFAWGETLTAKNALNLPYDRFGECGYGKSFEHWTYTAKRDFARMICNGDDKVVVLDFKSDFESAIQDLRKGVR